MGEIHPTLPVKFFVGILTSLPQSLPDIEDRLTASFGTVDLRSGEFPFDSTHYYDGEMGIPILRCFLSFRPLISPEDISKIKRATNGLEADLTAKYHQVSRPANLDPGYLEESKIVLASTKNFYHRILLSDGIYGEVTLKYSEKRWQPFPWSFPDFRSGRYDEFFTRLRQVYRTQLKDQRDNKER